MVTNEERDYMWQQYASDPQMRLNMGIRRRLAPLMENNRHRIELLNSLLFSLPGTPVVYYGDEIGMGDNVYLGDRNGVRTPMQWTGDRNAGFSRADPARLFAPPVHGSGLQLSGAERRGAGARAALAAQLDEAAARDPPAEQGLRPRHASSFLEPENHRVLAFVRELPATSVLVRREPRAVGAAGRARPAAATRASCRSRCSTTREFPRIGTAPTCVTLGPYGRVLVPAARARRDPDDDARRTTAGRCRRRTRRPAARRAAVGDAVRRPRARAHRAAGAAVRSSIASDGIAPAVCAAGGIALRGLDRPRRRRRASPARDRPRALRRRVLERYLVPLVACGGRTARAAAAEHPERSSRTSAAREPARSSTSCRTRDSCSPRASASLRGNERADEGGQGARSSWNRSSRPRVADEPARPHHPLGDARNIVALIGERRVLKLFRRARSRAHPEVAITPARDGPWRIRPRASCQRPSCIARRRATRSRSVSLGEQLPQQRNGWDHAVTDVERYLDRAAAETGGPPDDEVRPALPRRTRGPAGSSACGDRGLRRNHGARRSASRRAPPRPLEPGEGFGHAQRGRRLLRRRRRRHRGAADGGQRARPGAARLARPAGRRAERCAGGVVGMAPRCCRPSPAGRSADTC